MKVSLNLAHLPSRRERYALAWSVPLAVLGAVVLAMFLMLAVRNVREYRSVRKDVEKLQARNASLKRQEEDLRKALSQPQYRTVTREAQFVNALIEAKQLSATGLAAKVSRLMPASVRLSSLSLSAKKEPTVQFAIVAHDAKAVETFLTALEDSPDFQDVAISNQGFETEGGGEEPVTIICTARYVGGGKAPEGR